MHAKSSKDHSDRTERANLVRLMNGRRVAVRIAERAAIDLLATDGLENLEISAAMDISRQKARRWRSRFAAKRLGGIEKDAPRPSRLPQISAAQRADLVRRTLHETPEGQGDRSQRINDRADLA